MTDLDLPWPDIRDWAQVLLSGGLLFLTAVLAKATVDYTRATERMADATQAQADAVRHRPYVHLFLDWRWDTVGLRNIGTRIAHDVRVEIHGDFVRENQGFLAGSRLLTAGAPSLAPGDQVKESLGNTALRGHNMEVVDLTVSYSDAESHSYRERVTIRLGDAAEWFHSSPPRGTSEAEREQARFRQTLEENTENTARALQGIARTLSVMADGSSGTSGRTS